MKYVAFGSSSGQATDSRNVSGAGFLINEDSKKWILIDAGESTTERIKKSSLSLSNLDCILITHAHGDHVFGLFSLLTSLAINGRKSSLDIIAPIDVKKMCESVLIYSYSDLSYKINWNICSDELKIDRGEYQIEAIKMDHRIESYGFKISSSWLKKNINKEYLNSIGIEPSEIYGKIMHMDSSILSSYPQLDFEKAVLLTRKSAIAFIGGDNENPEILTKRVPDAGLWVHEATYMHTDWLKNDSGKKWGHSSAKLVGAASIGTEVETIILTHFSAKYSDCKVQGSNCIGDLIDEAKGSAKSGINILAAKDLEEIIIAAKSEIVKNVNKFKI